LTGQACFDTFLTSPGVDRAPRKPFHVANGASMFIAGQRLFVPRNGRRIGDIDSGSWRESSCLDEQSPFDSVNAGSPPEPDRNGCVRQFMCQSFPSNSDGLEKRRAHLYARFVSSISGDRCPKSAVDSDCNASLQGRDRPCLCPSSDVCLDRFGLDGTYSLNKVRAQRHLTHLVDSLANERLHQFGSVDS